METLDRKKKILQIVVQYYIKTGKPVSSKFIYDNFKLGCSPATIRNDLAELETDGHLTHPHTSAGRLPTDTGYRNYVDSILDIQRLTLEEEARLKSEYSTKMRELEDVMIHTSKLLAYVSNYAGFVVTSNFEKNSVKHIELVKLDTKHLLLVVVTEVGLVKHRIIETHFQVEDEQVRSLSKLLNQTMRGKKMVDVVKKLKYEIEKERIRQNQLLDLADELAGHIFSIASQNMVFIEGASNIIEQSDMNDVNNIKEMYKVIDQKNMLSKILNSDAKKQGIKISIGNENINMGMKNCSLISSTYKSDDNVVGVLGIIGPKRMEYSRMIAVVDYVSKLVNNVFSSDGERKSEQKRKR
ncbi:heat-inducible transcriptional repressor HrcA [bacterium]